MLIVGMFQSSNRSLKWIRYVFPYLLLVMAREMPIKHAQGFFCLFVFILLFLLDDVTENDVSQMLALLEVIEKYILFSLFFI